MAFLPSIFGSSDKWKDLERFNPQQKGFQNQALQQSQSLLSGLMQPTDTSGLANRYRDFLTNKQIPQQAEQYGYQYGTTPENSSGFRGFLGSALGELEGNVADLDYRAQQQDKDRQMNLFNLLTGMGMEPQIQRQFMQGRPGLIGNVTQGLGNYLGSGGGPIAMIINSLLGGSNLLGGRREPQQQQQQYMGQMNPNMRNMQGRGGGQGQQSSNQNNQLAALLQLLQQQQQGAPQMRQQQQPLLPR